MRYLFALIVITTIIFACTERSPEGIKANEDLNNKCVSRCALVSRDMDVAASYTLLTGCICEDKK